MLPEFSVLIEEFEQLCLDERAFFTLTNASALEVSIMYVRNEGTKPWTIWFNLSEDASKQRISQLFLEKTLGAFEIDTRELSSQLADRLLTQAAYADELVRKVGKLFGDEALREAIRSTQAFMESLQAMVSNIIGDAPNSTKADKRPQSLDSISRDATGLAARKVSHLKIIK
jgi:hypothetical protein